MVATTFLSTKIRLHIIESYEDCCGYYYQYGDHSGDLGKADFFGTIEGGFDYQLGSSFVAGILANYDFGKTKLKNTSYAPENYYEYNGPTFFSEDGSFKTEYEVGDSWAIGGRLGFLAMDNALIYVVGGYTEADVKSESTMNRTAIPISTIIPRTRAGKMAGSSAAVSRPFCGRISR